MEKKLYLCSPFMRDFTLHTYQTLLASMQEAGYQFITFEQYCRGERPEHFVILRHDVDLRAKNSLRTAKIENRMGIRASYYFRVVPESNQPEVIRAIAALGHEIGYHYEDMSICQGDIEKAMAHFREQLAYFRQYYPVSTICMHGAPTSKYDSKDLWHKYDYHREGIIGEPYFDADFSKMLYLTDTGRCWDGYMVSVRDKIPVHQERWIEEGMVFHTTFDIVERVEELGNVMITTHPQRWTNSRRLWLRELLVQKLKNEIKRALILLR